MVQPCDSGVVAVRATVEAEEYCGRVLDLILRILDRRRNLLGFLYFRNTLREDFSGLQSESGKLFLQKY